MTLMTDSLIKFFLLLMFLLTAMTASAQDARLRFEQLNYLEDKALDVVEVNIEGKLLDLAKRVLAKNNDPDAQKVGQAISGLKAIYVRVYNFEFDNQYNTADVEAIRSQLNAPGWERLANVRSKRNNQKVDVFTMFNGSVISGLAVVVSESKSVALVNVIGEIDIDLLAELSGKMNIPRIEIERDEKPKN